MAPKNKQSKGKDSSADADKSKGGKGGSGGGLKPATSINVRHILVGFSFSKYVLYVVYMCSGYGCGYMRCRLIELYILHEETS